MTTTSAIAVDLQFTSLPTFVKTITGLTVMIDAKPNADSKIIGCANPGSLFRQTTTLN